VRIVAVEEVRVVELIVGLVIGLAIGAALGALVVAARRHDDVGAATDRAALDAAQQRVADLEGTLARERSEHERAIEQLSDRFKVMADEALQKVVTSFRQGQDDLYQAREAALDERLGPLDKQLEEYQRDVRELDAAREKALADVHNAAQRLAEAQGLVLAETTKLNTILGRAGQRGRWGEVQLQRILEISGMKEHVDFRTQATVTDAAGERQRPDVVVELPQGGLIAIDSKVPYDAFDRAMSASDDESRDAALREYAAAVRGRINELKKKSYAAALARSPEYVVCFVPSDYLISVAFETDQSLLSDALESRVLVAGPTMLMGLLWSTYIGWSQFDTVTNIETIQALAERLVDRTGVLYGHLAKLGRNIGQSTKSYNDLIGSMERQLLVTVRDVQRHGVKASAEISDVEPITEFPRALDRARWPGEVDEDVIDIEEMEPGEIDEPREGTAGAR
jgi:DNA recombination protein RmuC